MWAFWVISVKQAEKAGEKYVITRRLTLISSVSSTPKEGGEERRYLDIGGPVSGGTVWQVFKTVGTLFFSLFFILRFTDTLTSQEETDDKKMQQLF